MAAVTRVLPSGFAPNWIGSYTSVAGQASAIRRTAKAIVCNRITCGVPACLLGSWQLTRNRQPARSGETVASPAGATVHRVNHDRTEKGRPRRQLPGSRVGHPERSEGYRPSLHLLLHSAQADGSSPVAKLSLVRPPKSLPGGIAYSLVDKIEILDDRSAPILDRDRQPARLRRKVFFRD